jgi:Pvc16 N-terminal domain
MSSTVIKDVTRGLQTLLLTQLTAVSSTAQVSLLPPGEALPSGLGVNLYLYRVIESPFTRNQPWPGDRTTAASNSPALGLDLFFLLTPFAPAPDASAANGDDAHTMLGAAMLTLHENPILNQVHLNGFDADAVLSPALLNSYEEIKIRLATTSLDELSKIWATINQPYRLSVAYEVSLVELTPTPPPPVNGAVVLSTNLNVTTWIPPLLNNLSPGSGALAHIDGSGEVAANRQISFNYPSNDGRCRSDQ